MAEKKQSQIIAQNKKAFHDYFVDERFEAGIALFGTEVKSLRQGKANLKDSLWPIIHLLVFLALDFLHLVNHSLRPSHPPKWI